MQLKEGEETIVYEETLRHFQAQLQTVRKIVESRLWIGKKHFPDVLVYQISTFVFHNPLRLKTVVYTHWPERVLKNNEKFILKGRLAEPAHQPPNSQVAQLNCEKSSERSAFVTLVRHWKALDVSEYGYAEIIQKGRLFLNFLANVKLKLHPQDTVHYDPIHDFDAFKRQEKERNKHYTLIADHLNIITRQFEEIQQYEKNKKISDVLIKAFVSLMSHNIAIVKIEENYNCQPFGCEGKYVYVANRHQLPFLKNEHRLLPREEKQAVMDSPWLQVTKKGEWKLGYSKHHGVSLYKQLNYPFKRGKTWLLNKKLQYFLQNDVWINAY